MTKFNFAHQGWECPKCGKVYSPTVQLCFSCGNDNVKTVISPFEHVENTKESTSIPSHPESFPPDFQKR